MKELLLRIENLSLSLLQKKGMFQKEETEVLRSVNLQLRKGEIVVLVGESGCGKTMLTKSLLGLLPKGAVVSGVLHYGGLPLSLPNFQKIASEKVIYIPQTVKALNPLLKIEEQLPLVTGELGKKSKGKYPFQSSGGMQKQALFSVLSEKPEAELIVADEPTMGMDTQTAKENLQDLLPFRDKNKAILLITHDIDLALDIADQIAVFREGELLECLSPEEFLQEKGNHPYTKELYRALPQFGFEGSDL